MKKILICDDDEALLGIIRLRLNKEDIGELFTARDGHHALKLLRENTFDLIITDIHMPYHAGDEVLKTALQNKTSKVVLMSSDTDEDVVALALKEGAKDFVKKPVNVDDLARRVHAWLK